MNNIIENEIQQFRNLIFDFLEKNKLKKYIILIFFINNDNIKKVLIRKEKIIMNTI